MSNRALAVSTALQTEMPELTVRLALPDDAPGKVSVFDGPVITVRDQIASGFFVTLYADEGDDIDGLTRDILRALTLRTFELADNALLTIACQSRDPLLDDSDYLVGQVLRFTTVEHSVTTSEAA